MGKNKKVEEEELFTEDELRQMAAVYNDLPFTNMDYALDLDAICDFINYADKHETREISITDAEAHNVPLSYDGENGGDLDETRKDMKTKEIREVKSHPNQQMDTLRYDLVKLMITYIMEPTVSDDGLEFPNTHSMFGYMTAINTMLKHKLMVKYVSEETDNGDNDGEEYYN